MFLDLEDAVAPDDKEQARANVIEALRAYDWTRRRRERAYQRARHPLVLPRRGRRRRGVRRRARHRARAEGRRAVRRRVRGDAPGSDRAAERLDGRPDRDPHPDRDRRRHGERRGDQPRPARPARGDGVRGGRLRRERPGPHDEHRRREPRLRGAHRPRAADRRPRDPLGRPVALRDQSDGGGVPRPGAAPDRRTVRRLQGRRRLPKRRPARGRPRLRGQVGDPPEPGRARERGLLPLRGRGRPGPADPAGDGGRGEGGEGSRLARRTADRRRVDPDGGEPDPPGRADRRPASHGRTRVRPDAPRRTRTGPRRGTDEYPRIPGEAAVAPVPGDDTAGRGRLHVEGRGARGRGARRSALGREGADPRGRPRQGRRREDRQLARRDRRDRRPDARLDARHRADRPRGPAREPRARRARLADRARVLPLAGGRPRLAADRRDRERPRAASTSRTSRPRTPTRSTRSTSIPVSASSTSSAARSRRRSGWATARRRSPACSSACTGSSATSTA